MQGDPRPPLCAVAAATATSLARLPTSSSTPLAGTLSARSARSTSGVSMCPSRLYPCWQPTLAVRTRLSVTCPGRVSPEVSLLWDCISPTLRKHTRTGAGMLIALIAHNSVDAGASSECGWYAVAFVFGERLIAPLVLAAGVVCWVLGRGQACLPVCVPACMIRLCRVCEAEAKAV